ncbi:capsular polysaccharide export protein, LipB/KpsS family [Limimaricola cinnabarinus]|uniref:capsular polysaccharide export protein, LipB/KpsS family n=1 Tax=Limimaricola cinnabarinus TaxID=1125964 RepID=UPI0013A601D1|nr:hypothetical protein [Limimaricola cinnabarinus]
MALEVPEAWFRNPQDGTQHRIFYSTLLASLAEMNVLIDPVWLPRGAERAPRGAPPDRFLISFHSYGEAGNVLRCKESYIPPFYTMDRMGYACFSELALFPERFHDKISRQDPDAARSFLTDLGRDLRQANRSKYSQPPKDGVRIDTGYVFVPLQIQNDSVVRGSWLDASAALDRIVSAASGRGLKTVIKRHPHCKSRKVARVLAEFGRNPDVTVSTGSIYDLIPGAEMVIGANSGVLFEALLQDRPVISFAASDFGLAVQQVRSHEELVSAITRPAPPDPVWRQKFLFWYLNQYCVRADDSLRIRRRIQSVQNGPKGSERSRMVRKLDLYAYSLLDRLRKRFF